MADEYDACAYCGWLGKLRKDGTMRKHRERADSGRIGSTGSLPQDPHAPTCKGTGVEPWKVDPLPDDYKGIRLNKYGGFVRDTPAASEPTLEDYSTAARHIESLMPGKRRSPDDDS